MLVEFEPFIARLLLARLLAIQMTATEIVTATVQGGSTAELLISGGAETLFDYLGQIA